MSSWVWTFHATMNDGVWYPARDISRRLWHRQENGDRSLGCHSRHDDSRCWDGGNYTMFKSPKIGSGPRSQKIGPGTQNLGSEVQPRFSTSGGVQILGPGGGPKFVIRDPDFRHPGGGHFLGPGGGPFFGSQGGVHFLGPRGSIFDRFQDPSAVVIRISLGVRTPIFPWKMDPGYAEF